MDCSFHQTSSEWGVHHVGSRNRIERYTDVKYPRSNEFQTLAWPKRLTRAKNVIGSYKESVNRRIGKNAAWAKCPFSGELTQR